MRAKVARPGRVVSALCVCPPLPLPLWQQCPPDKDQYIRLSLSPILCPHSMALYIRIFGNKLDIYRAEEIFTDKVHDIFWLSNVTTYLFPWSPEMFAHF